MKKKMVWIMAAGIMAAVSMLGLMLTVCGTQNAKETTAAAPAVTTERSFVAAYSKEVAMGGQTA